MVLVLVPLLVACAHGPSDCSHFNVTVVADESSPLLQHQHNHVAPVEYSTSIVDSEYIVTFISYYTTDARDGFISAALRPFNNWRILPRNNPSAVYPSDFSVVQLSSTEGEALSALNQHPAIKHVTPQKMLTRILTAGDGESMEEEGVTGSVWTSVVVCGEDGWQGE